MPDNDSRVDYRSLAEFRYQIRRFLRFSEEAARGAGVEPHQYQLLLAIKGLPPSEQPTVRVLAERLQVQHHSAVELIGRLKGAGLVSRHRDLQDRRQVITRITPRGEKILHTLAAHHLNELRSSGPALAETLRRLIVHEPEQARTARSKALAETD